ncbi:thioredoxin family protein [Stutzerimonas kirkiae]|uniref:Thiol reductase thioredoxin n=1 Tax=Stutzerimonas kirkiae TaxID=2211392 RepID=A0A4Q9RED1_9GAMM|nr:thioredoxin family protein [Stutzerimonas kirkiae]TBV00107.1 thiol reductase thioredoxin [Stutzerimonas kirkiae]TBV03450.1 thiol reductase thioredoxin [Stutzerimonas kirkiae]TBV05813.1 thiol reductase thioredoxin [Stutzerimonas kirkiae]TBV17311.1 thiol reductase thioredoxin [Stutzerimonas kirkiae]
MAMNDIYAESEPGRAEVDALPGNVLLEFGAPWCEHCQAAQPLLAEALRGQPVHHLKIEDGPKRRLGRSFKVKLWPTLILLRNGHEIARSVRPTDVREIHALLQGMDAQ